LQLAPVRVLPLGLTRSVASFGPTVAAMLLSALVLAGRRGARARQPPAAQSPAQRPPARRPRLLQPLALLALLALVRCAADPLPLEYYYLPVVFAVGAWETVALCRLPFVTALVVVVVSVMFASGLHLGDDSLNALSITASVALSLYLGRYAFSVPGLPDGRRLD
jgi:hypothetical protein